MLKRLCTGLVLSLSATTPALVLDYSLTVAATTSVEDSGLFAMLLPKFESRTGMKVQVLSRLRRAYSSLEIVPARPVLSGRVLSGRVP